MRNENREVFNSLLLGLKNRHGICRRSRLKTDREENNFFVRISARDFQAINWGINHADICSARFQHEKVAIGTGHAQHVAERAKNDVRALRDGVRFVDHFQ